MRLKLSSVLSILLLVGSNDGRPSKIESPEIIEEKASLTGGIVNDSASTWRPIESRSSSVVKTDSRTELKDLQYMDQSLRTVATQLLNVTNPNSSKDPRENKKIVKNSKQPTNVLLIHNNNNNNNEKNHYDPLRLSSNDKNDMELVEEINSGLSSAGSMGIGFGRPTNSKFGYFESSHPGQAMAMTEEELERELSASGSTRLMTAHKNQPTTTGGISTWILLNPPTTTRKTTTEHEASKEKVTKPNSNEKSTIPAEIFETTPKADTKSPASVKKIILPQSTTPMERITTLTKATTPGLKKTTVHSTIIADRTPGPTEPTPKTEKPRLTTVPVAAIVDDYSSVATTRPENSIATPKTATAARKPLEPNRSTLRPKITTPRSTNVTSKPMATKLSRPGDQATRTKAPPVRKTSTKSPAETTKSPSTSKIEKVTLRPVNYATTTPRIIDDRSNPEKTIFQAKIKASIATDLNEKPSKSASTNATSTSNDAIVSQAYGIEEIPKTKNKPPRTSNVLKVQLKKPTESQTNMEIEPIRVNLPILRADKIDTEIKSSPKRNNTKIVDPLSLADSQIDAKFEFNPEMTKIVAESSSPIDSIATTTRRPHKRKKNKLRRRKPATTPSASSSSSSSSSSTTTSQATTVSTIADSADSSTSTESLDVLTELAIADNAIQESKIAPESKISPGSVNVTKNKKKPTEKPIGTQIYNFLSREVMPSFGVMSLVGLGLGLASYFLYPFGGAIARRNYVVEPNYKYSMDEYGGNYGQNEEEVFSKVLQGMTSHDGKYGGIEDYEKNYQRYRQPYVASHYNTNANKQTTGRIPDTTRYSTVSAAIYRPHETASYEKYRNTGHDNSASSTTPNYRSATKKSDFVGKKSSNGQFVVGNVPKEYTYGVRSNFPNTLSVNTDNLSANYHDNEQDNYKFPIDSADTASSSSSQSSYGHAEAPKSNVDYDELDITPSAVQVEHGPRSLRREFVTAKLRRRRKRDSVIQLIPSRTEIEKEERAIENEEPLSNEILDIIDSVIPNRANENDNAKMPNGHENVKKLTLTVKEISANDSTRKKTESSTAKKFDDDVTAGPQAPIDDVPGIEKIVSTPERVAENIATDEKTNRPLEKITENPEIAEKTTKNSSFVVTTSSDTLDSTTSMTSVLDTTVPSLTFDEILGTTERTDVNKPVDTSNESYDNTTTASKPQEEVGFNVFTFVRKIAEVKLRLGVAILKHASEGFARYLGHVQKRINGEE